ncbi:MAG: hypothetical protein H7138_27945, partial [Myxococcales bacterium]|nr:hypothetical protein [Myxococcales bacterium]
AWPARYPLDAEQRALALRCRELVSADVLTASERAVAQTLVDLGVVIASP